MTAQLTFDRKTGMSGACRRIHGRVGLAGRIFAQAFFSDTQQNWGVEILNDEGAMVEEYTVDASQDSALAIEHVEALMSLAYRSATAPKITTTKVPARYLTRGDQVGSGETIVNVAAGIRTPRGKVEVTLEKDGHQRLAVWGASTVITVRRAA